MIGEQRPGGCRNLGMTMKNNSSGLNAIRFRVVNGLPYVQVAFRTGRAEFSVNANGPRGACERAIGRRRAAGLPVPTVEQAVRALNRFLRA